MIIIAIVIHAVQRRVLIRMHELQNSVHCTLLQSSTFWWLVPPSSTNLWHAPSSRLRLPTSASIAFPLIVLSRVVVGFSVAVKEAASASGALASLSTKQASSVGAVGSVLPTRCAGSAV